MSKLTPAQRAAMVKRVKELDAKMQNPRLSIERVDEMHRERSELRARLLEDRAEGEQVSDTAKSEQEISGADQ